METKEPKFKVKTVQIYFTIVECLQSRVAEESWQLVSLPLTTCLVHHIPVMNVSLSLKTWNPIIMVLGVSLSLQAFSL